MDLRYTSNEFREMLRLSQFSQSMGSVGDSYDNAMAEALWASLKKELVYRISLRHQRGGKNRDLRLDPMVQPEEETFKYW